MGTSITYGGVLELQHEVQIKEMFSVEICAGFIVIGSLMCSNPFGEIFVCVINK